MTEADSGVTGAVAGVGSSATEPQPPQFALGFALRQPHPPGTLRHIAAPQHVVLVDSGLAFAAAGGGGIALGGAGVLVAWTPAGAAGAAGDGSGASLSQATIKTSAVADSSPGPRTRIPRGKQDPRQVG